jgi:hypothetical protein
MADDPYTAGSIKVRPGLGLGLPDLPFGYSVFPDVERAARQRAIAWAIANNGLSGFQPSAFGRGVLSVWESGALSTEAGVARVIDHYKALATLMAVSSDGRARANALGVSDSAMLNQLEADVTTLRLAELQIHPVASS